MTAGPSFVGVIAGAAAVGLIGVVVRPRPQRAGSARTSENAIAARFESAVEDIRTTRQRGRPVPPEDVADWCDQLGRRMRSGSTLRDALMSTTPSGIALAHTTEDLRLALERGQPITTAVDAARTSKQGQHRRGPHVDLALAVIAIAARLGGSNASAFDRAAGSLRLLAADQQERSSQAAQARLSAHVLTIVPLAMLALLILTDDDVRATLQTPIGVACIAIGLVLNGAGWMWMRHIIGTPR